MRDAHPAILTALAGPYTKPGYLVEMTLDTPLRLSTRGPVDHDGSVWARGVDLERSADWSTVDLMLPNDGARTDFILGGTWRESRVQVWQYRAKGSRAWPFLETVEGWTAQNATASAVQGALRATYGGSGNIHIPSPDNLAIDGSIHRYVVFRLRVSSGVALPLVTVYYETAGHTYDTGYRKDLNLSAAGANFAVFVADMHALTAGGTDWATSNIKRFRFSIISGGNTLPSGCQLDFDWISLSSSQDGGQGVEVATLPLFDGVLSQATSIVPDLRLNARRSIGRGAYLPNIRIGPPWCNHLIAPGTVIKHGSDVYELQPGN